MAALIGLFVGAFVGYMLWHDWGAALGGIAGFMIGAKLNASRRAAGASPAAPAVRPLPRPPDALVAATDRERALVARIVELERRVGELERTRAGGASDEPFAAPQPMPAADGSPSTQPAPAAAFEYSPQTAATVPTADAHDAPMRVAPPEDLPATAAPVVSQTNRVWAWFTGGNALTRIGVVVLFFGVAFLLRYFAEYFRFPIELRLAAVAASGVALIALGAWLARSRPGY
ncbi:MAG TPA: DUF2339 domain-containing protein, partial [Casimicrobiaceae bacterium]|nr:DUF2339 domain-containing protein [Casimicrobiaceae bacterium]